jgi:vancomycin resistance protein YoaR
MAKKNTTKLKVVAAPADATPGKKGAKAKATTPAKAKPAAEAKPKKLSAIDAAAKVLGEAGQPMNCKEMIEAMAAKGYWTSPGGKTPHATLYSAILRECATKGKDARFTKTERGKFAAKA